MRKLNLKNKFLIIIFSLIIFVIIGLIVYAIRLTGIANNNYYEVSSNAVVFADDSTQINTKFGGKIIKNVDDKYQYLSNDKTSYSLGDNPIVYDLIRDNLVIFGESYQILKDGSVTRNTSKVEINSNINTAFYKLADRLYLIRAKEIYNSDKSIYANKYLIIYIDKQGNASLLNDLINLKTINPIVLTFDDYTFDVALEKLITNDLTIDLKSVIGSTNQYVVPIKQEDKFDYNEKELIESYNQLVRDFNQYAKNNNLLLSANNSVTNNQIIVNNNNSKGEETTNKTNINKRVSLRGAIASPNYIDVTYIVTDPENKYQAVYLLVTGIINNQKITEKIILDKYETTCRINSLLPKSEYTISLGYIEVIDDEVNKKQLVDNIEDVINVRTLDIKYTFNIEKISDGYVYFKFQMPSSYAFENADIVLYVDGNKLDSVAINYNEMISSKGFSGKFKLENGNIYQLNVENAIYNEIKSNYNISKKFVL